MNIDTRRSMMSVKRKCFMCGQEFEYCPSCRDNKPDEHWRFLYHDEKCLDISKIWYAYRGNEISKKRAMEGMKKIKPNIDAVLSYDSVAANEIKDIFGIKQKTEDPVDVINETSNEEKPDIVASDKKQDMPYVLETDVSVESDEQTIKKDHDFNRNNYKGHNKKK